MTRFKHISDTGTFLRFVPEKPVSGREVISVPKDFKMGRRDLRAEEKQNFLFRPFDLVNPGSVIFEICPDMPPKVGDTVIACETIYALRLLIERNTKNFEFVGIFPDEKSLTFFNDFLKHVNIFDVVTCGKRPRLDLKYNTSVQLNASPIDLHCDRVATGNLWNLLWAKWGIPGQPSLPAHETHLQSLNEAAKVRFNEVRGEIGLSNRDYVVFCMEGESFGNLKNWPQRNWLDLASRITEYRSADVLIIVGKADTGPFESIENVRFYRYLQTTVKPDLLTLTALINSSIGLVTLDTGPSHVAGLMHRPCISLFGPSAPVFTGHPRNINVRLSSCPPCGAYAQRLICARNICMDDIPLDLIYDLCIREFR